MERAREEAAEARRDVRERNVVWNGTSACYELNQSTNFRSKVLKVTI